MCFISHYHSVRFDWVLPRNFCDVDSQVCHVFRLLFVVLCIQLTTRNRQCLCSIAILPQVARVVFHLHVPHSLHH